MIDLEWLRIHNNDIRNIAYWLVLALRLFYNKYFNGFLTEIKYKKNSYLYIYIIILITIEEIKGNRISLYAIMAIMNSPSALTLFPS